MTESRERERRRWSRVGVCGKAVVHGATSLLRCDIVNVSTGGALLRASDACGDLLVAGAVVAVDLHLDAADTAWLHVRGEVRRLDDPRQIAVEFLAVTPQLEDLIGDEVLAGLEGELRAQVVVVEQVIGRRVRVALALRGLGCHVLEVATPLDAISVIEQSRAHIGLVLVGERAAEAVGSLSTYLRGEHPEIDLVTIADRPPGGRDRRGWLYADQADLGVQLRRLMGAHLPAHAPARPRADGGSPRS
jgi:hypothetical protein